MRKKIDEINFDILELLKKRDKLIRDVGKYKKKNNLPITDKDREDEMYEKLFKNAEEKGLSKDFVKDIFERIVREAKRNEK